MSPKSPKRTHRIRPFRPAWKALKRAWRRLAPPPDRGYMICATPRSGSNYLSYLLASTGVLGNPREYFNAPGRRRYDDPAYPDDPREQLKQVLTTGRTANGIYAVKVHHFQIAGLRQMVDPLRDLPNLRFVVLTRRDVLRQAVSWSRARQTGQFRATDAARHAASYDQGHIRDSLLWLVNERVRWERMLREQKVRPLVLSYEAMMQDPQRAVDRVAALMTIGQRPRIDPTVVSLTVQRDETTEEWRARFLAETGGEFRHLADPPEQSGWLARHGESL